MKMLGKEHLKLKDYVFSGDVSVHLLESFNPHVTSMRQLFARAVLCCQ